MTGGLSIRWRLTAAFALLSTVLVALVLGGVYLLVTEAPAPGSRPHDSPGVVWTDDEQPVIDPEEVLEGPARGDAASVQATVEDVAAESVGGTVRSLRWWSLLGVAGAALLSACAGWYVAGRALRPVHLVTERARELALTGRDERIELEGPYDEVGRMSETVDELLARLHQSLAHERRMVASISHELRTPLANQQVALDVALEDPALSLEELRAVAQSVRAEAGRASRTVEALLALARAEAGLGELEREDVSYDALVRRVAERKSHPELSLHLDLDRTSCRAHPALLERAVANLLGNALAYNAPGGDVWLRLRRRGGDVVLAVENTGPVVAAELAAELALPFRRGDSGPGNPSQGAGLGLAIARAIAVQHGGELVVRARDGGGLVVELVLPVGDRAASCSRASSRPDAALGSVRPGDSGSAGTRA